MKKERNFYNFIKEYGWNSFKWNIIKHYNTEEEMIQGEIDQIEIYKKKYPNWECLNSTEGGEGGILTKEAREKMSEKKKHFLQTPEGIKWRKEHSKKLKGWEGYWTGKKRPNISGDKHPRAVSVVLISPDGVLHQMKSYYQFCLEQNLSPGHICQVLNKRRSHHKSWRAEYE